jgi:hypothetical protein
MAGRLVGLLITVLALTIGALPASAAAAFTPGMQPLLNSDGTGRLFATAGGTGPFTWDQCAVDQSTCSVAGTGQDFSFADAPDGTVFRPAGGSPAEVSPVWHGNLTISAPPSIAGRLRANQLVIPVLAGWQGGWEGDIDQTQLAVCATPAGEGCTSISDHKYPAGCDHGGAVLDPSFVGRYLRVADRKLGPGTVETLEADGSPYGHPIWPAEGDTAVAVVGRIGRAVGGRTQTCGPKPLVEAWISSRGVAKVSCAFGCLATLYAGHAGNNAWASLRVPATGLPPLLGQPAQPEPSGSTLAVSPGELRRLDGGQTRFAVEVGGQIFARKRIELPSPKHNRQHHKQGDGKR